mmetsp:Transcript_137883/g.257237  ORF Transcript_137883/g.257237 Transcript_137883/m.257237 type:complete len:91 (+) Transcript_137883:209-481(+)
MLEHVVSRTCLVALSNLRICAIPDPIGDSKIPSDAVTFGRVGSHHFLPFLFMLFVCNLEGKAASPGLERPAQDSSRVQCARPALSTRPCR